MGAYSRGLNNVNPTLQALGSTLAMSCIMHSSRVGALNVSRELSVYLRHDSLRIAKKKPNQHEIRMPTSTLPLLQLHVLWVDKLRHVTFRRT